MVDHQLLLSKNTFSACTTGPRNGLILFWVTNRNNSDNAYIPHGVPQGSILAILCYLFDLLVTSFFIPMLVEWMQTYTLTTQTTTSAEIGESSKLKESLTITFHDETENWVNATEQTAT